MTLDNAIIVLLAESRIKLEEKEKTIINLTSINNSLADELNKAKQQITEIMNQTANARECMKLVDRVVEDRG